MWGVRKRNFRGDWEKRLWLFDKFIWAVISYEMELWGWKEKKGERLQDRYLRWVLGVKRYTPGYMVRKEIQREM